MSMTLRARAESQPTQRSISPTKKSTEATCALYLEELAGTASALRKRHEPTLGQFGDHGHGRKPPGCQPSGAGAGRLAAGRRSAHRQTQAPVVSDPVAGLKPLGRLESRQTKLATEFGHSPRKETT